MRKVLFTKGIPLKERLAMLVDYELLFLRSLKEMGSTIGIQDIDAELRAWKQTQDQNAETPEEAQDPL
jgi:hypothetical protein